MSTLVEVTLSYQYQGQNCQNVWVYEATEDVQTARTSELILEAMGFIPDETDAFPGGTVFSALRTLQSNLVTYTSVYARDIYSEFDFDEVVWTPSPVGLVEGVSMSPALAYGFRTNRVRTNVRRGTKRFAGIPAAYNTVGGGYTEPVKTSMSTLALRMSATLTADIGGGQQVVFEPSVAGKQRYDTATGLPSPTGNAYRYYEDWEEQQNWLAVGVEWQPYDRQRTQRSRQYGVGR